jgi:hypothetical protein
MPGPLAPNVGIIARVGQTAEVIPMSCIPTLRQAEHVAWAGLLLLFTGFAVHMAPVVLTPLLLGHYAPTDFFAQWSFAVFAHQTPSAAIYDAEALHHFQLSLRPDLRQTFPYPYPPSFLLFLWPLGWLSYAGAYAAWVGVTLGLYLIASLAAAWRVRDAVCLILAPVTVLTAVFGQTGFLFAALMVGGIRLLDTRPVMAGVLFGLLSFKPQFAVLIPVALIAGAQWRCLLAAAATAALLVLASALAFGAEAWTAWIEGLPAHAAYVDTAVNALRKQSILANLMLLHIDRPVAWSVQAISAAAAVILVWQQLPRADARQRIAVIAGATFLAAPYAFVYDMPVLTNAALAMLAMRPSDRWHPEFAIVAALLLGFPAVVTLTTRFFWLCSVALILFAVLLAWRTRATEPAGG